jgi:hypothetical protein
MSVQMYSKTQEQIKLQTGKGLQSPFFFFQINAPAPGLRPAVSTETDVFVPRGWQI